MTAYDERVKNWFLKLGWNNVAFKENDNVARVSLVGKNTDFFCTFLWVMGDERNASYFEVITHCPIKTPKEKRGKIAECLLTLNRDRHFSHFILDYADGEITCKSTIFHETDSIFNENVFQGVLNMSLGGMDLVFPLITKLIYSDISVEIAIKEWIESLE